jgi:hypothetical protein
MAQDEPTPSPNPDSKGDPAMSFQIKPLPQAFLDRVRNDGLDDQGQPVQRLTSRDGGEPCRDVLRRARPGEELILASFCPYDQAGPFREHGPVFVLARASSEPVDYQHLPTAGSGPTDYFRDQLALRAYGVDESIRDAALVPADQAAETAARFLDAPDTAFVQARFPTFGCFACHIERAS